MCICDSILICNFTYVISQVKTEIVAKAIYHLSEQLGGIVEDVQQVIYPCFAYNSLMVIFDIFSF